jgi:hypothetical protein
MPILLLLDVMRNSGGNVVMRVLMGGSAVMSSKHRLVVELKARVKIVGEYARFVVIE